MQLGSGGGQLPFPPFHAGFALLELPLQLQGVGLLLLGFQL